MPRTNRNFVFAYAFLVILPLAGLVGILRGGHNLKAPVSIDGVWNLHADSTQLASLACGKLLATIPDKAMSISQSGKSFALSFPGAPQLAGSGTLAGTILQAYLASPDQTSGNNCSSAQAVSLTATVNKTQNPSTLTGTLSVANCPSCAPVNFQAERQAAPVRQEGQ
jgi:hypothetical protein